ncbi:uncharacterized protein LOC126655320 [Mercurialis annua]|uniref:uncharacterized protein LOC126655320 n=1 Tax=Mercurialis annua TaxID=3986 RepID=UPI00215E345D|nr:uncharacterized protein LOC126655320 [Mercurialis annua]
MSSAPKRSHEEGGHSSTPSKYPHEESASYPKLTSATSTEYHPSSYDVPPDARIPKIPPRDADRRSPLHAVHRVLLSPADLHMDAHSLPSETRLDSRDCRDLRLETRDPRTEAREMQGEAKRDSQNVKIEKDVRLDIRPDETKEIKYDKDAYNDPKTDSKVEKDGFSVTTSQLNWKDSKEYHRGKRYSEPPGGHVDPWNISRAHSQGAIEIGKEAPKIEERDFAESHEAVGENKVDLKGEDRFKDKDRKRKDMKHREWGDRDKERSDRRSNISVGNSSAEGKESTREEREPDRWERERERDRERERERERKDIMKDRDRLKEKDHTKRELWNGVDRESLQNEKESGDVSVRMTEQENLSLEQKKQKDFDGWKNVEREARDRRKERDTDVEGDRPEKRSRLYEKESDDGCADEGATEREREVFGYGVQQRKRMIRPRGSPQVTSREPRFKSHTQENEGSQGKLEVSSVVYKVGECMQDLIKLWRGFLNSYEYGKSVHNGPTLEIRIPAEHVTATNRQVRGGQLWGTDIYTDDSDLVAVLMHTGYCRPTASPPPAAIQELRATIRVLPSQDSYTSMLRNNVRSRAWGAGIGCSYRVERCCIVKRGGGTIDLEPCLTHTSAVEPTLAPVAVERTMTTRAAASNALRQQRFVREVTIQYNLCNEPWIKYSISIIADKGLKKPLYTSARLKKGEVLYLETHSCRYELCFTGEKMVKATQLIHGHEEAEKSHNHLPHTSNGEKMESDNILTDVFRWSRCKKPLPQKVMRSVGIPLPSEFVEVLEENVEWEDVQWSQTGVWIAGKEYTLARVHFLSLN